MELLDIFGNGKQYGEQVWALYEQAFPPEEKKTRRMLEELAEKGKMELLAVQEDGGFAGLAMNMLAGDKALLDYFAIAPQRRGGGVGSRAVQLLQKRFAGKKYILEIEMQDEKAENAVLRRRRKDFYLRNGLKETGVFANIYHTDFELLTPDGELKFEEYIDVLREILGEEGLEFLKPVQLSAPPAAGEIHR